MQVLIGTALILAGAALIAAGVGVLCWVEHAYDEPPVSPAEGWGFITGDRTHIDTEYAE